VNNYEFCAHWVNEESGSRSVKVLDYGCGAGEIVKLLRKQGVDAYGCDVFYEGGDYSTKLGSDLLGTIIRRMDDSGAVPFDASTFDLVINNQVMEHVEDLDRVLAEVSRVLKPGGKVLSLFPDKSVWREGHCGIPFLHRFPKGSRPRVYYALAWRTLGFGHFKTGKSRLKWCEDFCQWLDKWTWYRSRRVIDASYRSISPHRLESKRVGSCCASIAAGASHP